MDLIDAHMHVPRLSTVSAAWYQWAEDYSKNEPWREVFGADGDPVPERFDALMAAQNVTVALAAGGGTLSAEVEFVWHAENPEIRRSMPASNRVFLRA